MTDKNDSTRSLAMKAGVNALAFLIFWIVAFGLSQLGSRIGGGWFGGEIGRVLASMIGVLISVRLRARPIAYFLTAMIAFTISEFAIHAFYGVHTVQGAPAHIAVTMSGIAGVGLGALLAHYFAGALLRRSENSKPVAG